MLTEISAKMSQIVSETQCTYILYSLLVVTYC